MGNIGIFQNTKIYLNFIVLISYFQYFQKFKSEMENELFIIMIILQNYKQ